MTRGGGEAKRQPQSGRDLENHGFFRVGLYAFSLGIITFHGKTQFRGRFSTPLGSECVGGPILLQKQWISLCFLFPLLKGTPSFPEETFRKVVVFSWVLPHFGTFNESVCFAGMLFFVAFKHFRGVRFAADAGARQLPDRKNGKQRGKLLLGPPGDTLSAQIMGALSTKLADVAEVTS